MKGFYPFCFFLICFKYKWPIHIRFAVFYSINVPGAGKVIFSLPILPIPWILIKCISTVRTAMKIWCPSRDFTRVHFIWAMRITWLSWWSIFCCLPPSFRIITIISWSVLFRYSFFWHPLFTGWHAGRGSPFLWRKTRNNTLDFIKTMHLREPVNRFP